MGNHNIWFYFEFTKIIIKLPSNTHFFSGALKLDMLKHADTYERLFRQKKKVCCRLHGISK